MLHLSQHVLKSQELDEIGNYTTLGAVVSENIESSTGIALVNGNIATASRGGQGAREAVCIFLSVKHRKEMTCR